MANNYGYMAKIHLSVDDSDIDNDLKSVDAYLKDIGTQVKTVQKAIETADKAGADSTELQRSGYELLEKQIDAAYNKVELLQSVYEKADSAFMNGSMDTGDWAQYQTDLVNARSELQKIEVVYESLKSRIEETSSVQTAQSNIYENLKNKVSEYDNSLADEKKTLSDINSTINSARNSHISFSEAMELNRQKTSALNEISSELTNKLNELKGEAANMKEALQLGNISQSEYDEFLRKLIDTKAELENLKNKTGEYSDEAKNAGENTSVFGDVLKANLTSDAIEAGARKLLNVLSEIVNMTKELINETKEAGDTIDKQSQILGLSREAYQEWDYILSLNGASIGNLTTATRTMTNAVEKAQNGTKSAVQAFEKLGISVDSLSSMSREDLFERIIYGLQGITDEQIRNETANDLLGRSYTQLIPLLNQSAESTAALKQAAHESGMIMSDEAVDAAVKYKDALTTLDYTAKGFKENLISELLPGLTGELLPIAQDFLETLNNELPELKNSVLEFADRLYPKLEELEKKLSDFMTDKGLPAVLDALEWLIDNGDEVVGFLTALAAAWAVDKIIDFGTALSKIPVLAANAADAIANLSGKISSLSGVSSASVTAIGAVAAELAVFCKIIADELDTISDGLNRITRENKKSTDNIADMEEKWNNITNLSGIDRYRQVSDFYSEIIAKEEEWSSRYQKTINELNTLNEKKIKSADETARQKELQSQKESLDAEYEMLQLYHVKTEKELSAYNDDKIRQLENGERQRQNVINSQGATTVSAVAKVEENIIAGMKDKMTELDHQLKINEITEEQYWAEKKKYLEAHRISESEEWHDYYNDVIKHYDKLSETERKAAEKAANEAETAQVNQFKDKLSQIELTAMENENLSSGDIAQMYLELALEQEKGSDQYIEAYKKYLTKKQAADKEAAEEEKNSFKKRKEEIERTAKEYTAAGMDEDTVNEWIVNEYKSLAESYEEGSDYYLEAYEKYLDKKIALDKKIKENEENAIEEQKKLAEEREKELEKSQSDYLKSGNALTETVKSGGKDRLVLNDLQAEKKSLQKYRESMEKLKATGISDDLINGIMQFDYKDGSRQDYIDELLGMSEEKRQQYYNDYAEYIAETKKTAEYDLGQTEQSDAEKTVEDSAISAFDSVTEQTYDKGAEAAAQYLKGISDTLNNNPVAMSFLSEYKTKTNRKTDSDNISVSDSKNAESVVSGGFTITLKDGSTGRIIHKSTLDDMIKQAKMTGGNVFNV